MTPERRAYAEKRLKKLNAKLLELQKDMGFMSETELLIRSEPVVTLAKAIVSTKTAIRRWLAILEDF
jgi:3-methyladenine DNA glycosylase/8-oxoguanine DNA glycosylase